MNIDYNLRFSIPYTNLALWKSFKKNYNTYINPLLGNSHSYDHKKHMQSNLSMISIQWVHIQHKQTLKGNNWQFNHKYDTKKDYHKTCIQLKGILCTFHRSRTCYQHCCTRNRNLHPCNNLKLHYRQHIRSNLHIPSKHRRHTFYSTLHLKINQFHCKLYISLCWCQLHNLQGHCTMRSCSYQYNLCTLVNIKYIACWSHRRLHHKLGQCHS